MHVGIVTKKQAGVSNCSFGAAERSLHQSASFAEGEVVMVFSVHHADSDLACLCAEHLGHWQARYP